MLLFKSIDNLISNKTRQITAATQNSKWLGSRDMTSMSLAVTRTYCCQILIFHPLRKSNICSTKDSYASMTIPRYNIWKPLQQKRNNINRCQMDCVTFEIVTVTWPIRDKSEIFWQAFVGMFLMLLGISRDPTWPGLGGWVGLSF